MLQDDHLPMRIDGVSDRDALISSVWLSDAEVAELMQWVIPFYGNRNLTFYIYRAPLPMNLPWSQTFYLCCQDVS